MREKTCNIGKDTAKSSVEAFLGGWFNNVPGCNGIKMVMVHMGGPFSRALCAGQKHLMELRTANLNNFAAQEADIVPIPLHDAATDKAKVVKSGIPSDLAEKAKNLWELAKGAAKRGPSPTKAKNPGNQPHPPLTRG